MSRLNCNYVMLYTSFTTALVCIRWCVTYLEFLLYPVGKGLSLIEGVFVLLERTVALPIMRHSGLILSTFTILSGICHPVQSNRHFSCVFSDMFCRSVVPVLPTQW